MYSPAITTFLIILAISGTDSRIAVAAESERLVETQGASGSAGLDELVKTSRQTIEQLHRKGDKAGESKALLDLGNTYQHLGQIRLAIQTLEAAIRVAGEGGLTQQQLEATAALGAALTFSKRADEAEPMLRKALEAARESHKLQIEARVLNDLGNVLAARKQNASAAESYGNSARVAKEGGEPLLAAKATLNQAGVSEGKTSVELSRRGLKEARELPDSSAKAALLLSGSARLQKSGESAVREESFTSARDAFRLAKQCEDERTMADAMGSIGSLYESGQQLTDALRATREALLHAQAAQVPEAQYRWAWQEGRVLAAQGERTAAIAAYRRAISSVDAIRHDLALSLGNANRDSSFRESLGPLYFQLADLLLQQSASETDSEKAQAALREARDTIELLKSAELVDYFQDDCVNLLRARTAGIEKISPSAAIIYLIPLPARTELLVGFADGWQRFSIGVGEAEFTRTARLFRTHLETRTSYEFLIEGRKLYDWLVRPLEAALSNHGVDTLVFVPDGAARTIPLGALHNGEHFLISRYAVAVTPGATLMDPRAVERKSARILLGGLSDSVQGFLPLSCVPHELDAIEQLHGGTILLNREFFSERVEDKFAANQYSIMHLASHGRFDRDARKTFILTHDAKMTLDDLERMVRPSQFRGRPVELMTLSACQTAAGDDRAALGMAGVAVKAGARSAVASLWFVNDQSSSELISSFYKNLWAEPTRSKAQAMQKAQLALLASRTYQHPCYWAPYLVIGNWL